METQTVQVNRDPAILAAIYAEYGERFEQLPVNLREQAFTGVGLRLINLATYHASVREVLEDIASLWVMPRKFTLLADQLTPTGLKDLVIALLNSLPER